MDLVETDRRYIPCLIDMLVVLCSVQMGTAVATRAPLGTQQRPAAPYIAQGVVVDAPKCPYSQYRYPRCRYHLSVEQAARCQWASGTEYSSTEWAGFDQVQALCC
jgi:hypothetical protein